MIGTRCIDFLQQHRQLLHVRPGSHCACGHNKREAINLHHVVHDQLRLAENRHAAYSLAYKTGANFWGHFGGKNPRLIAEEIR